MKPQRPSLAERLRQSTKERHDAVERVALFRALRAGELPRTSLVSYLRGLTIVHAGLETALSRRFGASYGPWRAGSTRVDDLMATLEAAGATGMPDVPRAVDAALAWADTVMLESERGPALLGMHYVLEGSQLGGHVLRDRVAGALGVAPERVTYYRGDAALLGPRWEAYRADLNAMGLDGDEQEVLIEAAHVAYDGVEAVASAAFPYQESELRHRLTAINPEAGRHAMPRSEVEIARALRCAKVSWDRFPYLAERFGERGRRYTNSDSCWLVSLYDEPAPSVVAGLRWLRIVLASRGLPTVILEQHLEAIERDVALDDPARAAASPGFRSALESFRAERDRLLAPAIRRALRERWQPRFDAAPGLRVAAAADLLIGARLDTALGVTGAWTATHGWFVDPARFSGAWIEAVGSLAAELETAVGA